MAIAVGYTVTLVFVLGAAALHAYADARPVAARDSIRIALVALVGANSVGAAFFAIRTIPSRPVLGSLAAFAVAFAPVAARVSVLAVIRIEENRRATIAAQDGDDEDEAIASRADKTTLWPHADGVIRVREDALIVLVGAAGCGKSTFASRRFAASTIVSSDECRLLVSDDAGKPSPDAFRLMYTLIGMRLKRERLTIADATNVTIDKRAELLAIAAQYRRPAVAIVFDLPEDLCRERNEARTERVVPVPAIRGQVRHVRESIPHLAEEGFAAVHVLKTAEDLDDARIEIAPVPEKQKWSARKRPVEVQENPERS